MRRVGDLMKELGFREGASDEVKIAFIKNLIRSAYGVEVHDTQNLDKNKALKAAQQGEQLAFEMDEGERRDPVESLFAKRKSS